MADVQGDTLLHLYGEGFMPFENMSCVFAGDVMVCPPPPPPPPLWCVCRLCAM